MKNEGYYECSYCHSIHKVEIKPPDDLLYIDLYCNECRRNGPHLWVGEIREDYYLYYDVTQDEKFFNYDKTK